MNCDSPFEMLNCYLSEDELIMNSKSFLSSYRSGISKAELESSFLRSFGLNSRLFCEDDELFGLANELMIRYYHNESFIKSSFLSKFAKKANKIWAYEVPVGHSRADLCELGRISVAYEIKTEYDSFYRLEKQLDDYRSFFCKVFVIVPESQVTHLSAILDSDVGIISYKTHGKRIRFTVSKEASLHHDNRGKLDALLGAAQDEYREKWDFLSSKKNQLFEMDYQWAYTNQQLPAYLR